MQKKVVNGSVNETTSLNQSPSHRHEPMPSDDINRTVENSLIEQTCQSNEEATNSDSSEELQVDALEYLIDKLKETYLERNQHLIEKFQNFVDVVPELYKTLPYDYESTLADIFWDRLQHHGVARVGLVQVFLNVLDPAVLSDYCRNLIEDELKTLTEKSPFRLRLEEFYNEWSTLLNEKKERQAGDYRESEMQERITQMKQLHKALSYCQSSPNITGSNASEKKYPDDELVTSVLSILKNGKMHHLTLLDRALFGQEDLSEFLVELNSINDDRLSKTLIAHDETLVFQDYDVLLAVKTLHYQNLRLPYFHRLFSLVQALIIQNSKLIQRHYHVAQEQGALALQHMGRVSRLEINHDKEISTLKKTIIDLQGKIKTLQSRTDVNSSIILPIISVKPSPVKTPLTVSHSSPMKVSQDTKIKAPPELRANLRHRSGNVDIAAKQAEELKRLLDENTELKKKNALLSVKLADAEHRCAILPNIENDNKELRRRLVQMDLKFQAMEFQPKPSIAQNSSECGQGFFK